MTDALQDQLARYYREVVAEQSPITRFDRISDGWENEVYAFDKGSEALILRIYPGSGAIEKSTREFSGMRHLHALGYPVPQVYIHELDAQWLGRPFVIMQRINGRSLLGVLHEAAPERQAILLERMMRLFVDLHALDWQAFVFPGTKPEQFNDPTFFIALVIAHYQREIEATGFNALFPALEWMRAHRDSVPLRRPGVIHGDYHPNNLLLTPDDRFFVIDWPSIMAGDPLYDLAWTLLLVDVYESTAMRDRMLAEYNAVRGEPVSENGLVFYEVVACLRRLMDVMITLQSGGEARGMRPETAAIVRSQGDHIRRVVAILQARIGEPLDELKNLLESLLNPAI